MTIILAILTGFGLGYIIERGDLCFHSTLRGLVQSPRQLDLFRAYLLSILVATPLVYALIAMDLINPWIPPFVWQANLVGGLIFGVGMVIAATCITGLFYKLGHGMLGTLAGLIAWAIGDILTYQGPLSSLREMLNQNPIMAAEGQSVTAFNIAPPFVSLSLIIGLGLLSVLWLWRSPQEARGDYWRWGHLGLAVGLFTAFAWLLASAKNINYTYGTSNIPSTLFIALTQGGGGQTWFLWFFFGLLGITLGAFVAAKLSGTLWIRGETLRRYAELALGSFLMGIGAAIAGGCNLGHGLVGVPLLSLGSITTVVAMTIGVWLADRATKLVTSASSQTARVENIG